jgi:rhodanese-related sulfurtransferase
MEMSRPKTSRGARGRTRLGWWLALALVAAGAAALAIWRWAGTSTAEALPAEISVAEAAAKRDAGAFILDVREPDEWEAAHIAGATLIPLGRLSTRLAEVPRNQEIVVVCRSGNRSRQGRDLLLEAGFDRVTSMAGGLTDWLAQGYPTVSEP